MRISPFVILVALGILSQMATRACIWDADTLSQEKRKSPKLAEVILGKTSEQENPEHLHDKIKKLEANRRESDPAWWNDLAGAHLRLGEAKEAAELLEKVVQRFPNNYGIHANLGTAYHLLGRYNEAEREIAYDLEINPDSHFGLEKYHLALLQYLMRDTKYQSRHVYVDEFTAAFLSAIRGRFYFSDSFEKISKSMAEDYTRGVAEAEADYESLVKNNREEYLAAQMLGTVAALDNAPAYREKWNLAQDSKLQEGVVYMASLNPKEPACLVMLGLISWKNHDLNLAAAAFEKAIKLGSPQSEMLRRKTEGIRSFIQKSQQYQKGEFIRQLPAFVAIAAIVGAIILYVIGRYRRKPVS